MRKSSALTCVEEDHPKGRTGAHLPHQGQAQSDPVKLLRDEASRDTGDSTQDLTEGEDGTTVRDVDGEEDDDVGDTLHASHEAGAHEELQLAGVETEAVEAERDH